MQQAKDRAGHWMLEHYGDLPLRLAGVRNIASYEALKGDLVAPRRFPDGLLEVKFNDRPGTAQYLIEIETDPSPDADRQMGEDLMALALDRRPLPTGIVLVLRPKGNARVTGRYEWTSADGRTRFGGEWQVVNLWELEATDLLAQNDVGLIPWVPLTHHDRPPEELLIECRDRIDRDAPPDRHEGLLAVTGMLASALYDKGMLNRLFAGGKQMINLMDFPLVRDLVEEREAKGRQEGRQEGRLAARVEDIAGILAAKFTAVPDDLRTQLSAVTDDARLTQLRDLAVTCPDLEAFRVALAAG